MEAEPLALQPALSLQEPRWCPSFWWRKSVRPAAASGVKLMFVFILKYLLKECKPFLLPPLLGHGMGRIANTEQQNCICRSEAVRAVGSSKPQPLWAGNYCKIWISETKGLTIFSPRDCSSGLVCFSLLRHSSRALDCEWGLGGEGSPRPMASLGKAATTEILRFNCLYSCQIHLVHNSFCSEGYMRDFCRHWNM